MKRVLMLSFFLSVCTISILASPAKKAIELSKFTKAKVLKSSGSTLLFEVPYKSALDKERLNKFWVTFTVNLSCVSITYSGQTAQIGIQIAIGGGLGLLLGILEAYWCGGGYGQAHPGPAYA